MKKEVKLWKKPLDEEALCIYCDKKNTLKSFKYVSLKSIEDCDDPTSVVCINCRRDYCQFCLNCLSEDSCIMCGKSFCSICARVWNRLTGRLFMYGDHDICYYCDHTLEHNPDVSEMVSAFQSL